MSIETATYYKNEFSDAVEYDEFFPKPSQLKHLQQQQPVEPDLAAQLKQTLENVVLSTPYEQSGLILESNKSTNEAKNVPVFEDTASTE